MLISADSKIQWVKQAAYIDDRGPADGADKKNCNASGSLCEIPL